MSTQKFADLTAELRTEFNHGTTKSYRWRYEQLSALLTLVDSEESRILQALSDDLGKPRVEALSAEILFIRDEVQRARSALKGWMKPKRTSTPLILKPAQAWIYPDPLGVVT